MALTTSRVRYSSQVTVRSVRLPALLPEGGRAGELTCTCCASPSVVRMSPERFQSLARQPRISGEARLRLQPPHRPRHSVCRCRCHCRCRCRTAHTAACTEKPRRDQTALYRYGTQCSRNVSRRNETGAAGGLFPPVVTATRCLTGQQVASCPVMVWVCCSRAVSSRNRAATEASAHSRSRRL